MRYTSINGLKESIRTSPITAKCCGGFLSDVPALGQCDVEIGLRKILFDIRRHYGYATPTILT